MRESLPFDRVKKLASAFLVPDRYVRPSDATCHKPSEHRSPPLALPSARLSLVRPGGMGEGKAGICGDGTIERLDRAGVHGQLRLTGLYVGVPCGERRRGQGESVSVRQHDGLIRYSTRNDTISLDARERGLLARKGLVCDLADWGWPLLPTRLPRCAQPGSRKKDLAKDQPGHRAVDQKIVLLDRRTDGAMGGLRRVMTLAAGGSTNCVENGIFLLSSPAPVSSYMVARAPW